MDICGHLHCPPSLPQTLMAYQPKWQRATPCDLFSDTVMVAISVTAVDEPPIFTVTSEVTKSDTERKDVAVPFEVTGGDITQLCWRPMWRPTRRIRMRSYPWVQGRRQ